MFFKFFLFQPLCKMAAPKNSEIKMKKILMLGIGALTLSSLAVAGELASGVTPKFSDIFAYHRFNGSGSVSDQMQIWNSGTTYAIAHNRNASGLNYVSGKLNQGLSFDGIDDYLDLGTKNEIINYSIIFWVKRAALGTGLSTIVHRGDATSCFYNPNISIDNTTGMMSVSESGCGGTGLIASANISSDQYFHVAVTRSATGVSVYVNGALIKTVLKAKFTNGGSGRLTVGSQNASGVARNFLKGNLDDLAFFQSTLSDAEVKTIYQSQLSKYSLGSFERPFLADSYWNSKPVDPILGSVAIPTYAWFPTVAEGDYSSSVYNAVATDPAVVVTAGDADSYVSNAAISIPHFPANVTPAKGGDGHADIVDMSTGFIHSFWQLKKDATTGKWSAASYNSTKIGGTGFGDPAHSQAGARAAGTATMAGMIRTHEIDDGQDKYNHALALSLDGDTFLKNVGGKKGFEFPTTAEDSSSMSSYTKVDGFAMGSLLMLPKNFNVASLKLPRLQKVARTLMTYGAYVVDQNTDTPFSIYVQNGSNYSNNPGYVGSWDTVSAADLRTIQYALRKVVSNSGYVDANGINFVPNKKVNILSMRGEWTLPSGANSSTVSSGFNSYKQALVFSAAAKGLTLNNYWNNGILKANDCSWACRKPGVSYRFKVRATNGAKMAFKLRNSANTAYAIDTGLLGDGAYVDFVMPAYNSVIFVQAVNGSIGASEIAGELTEK
jgi:hypothetical protein